MRKVERIDIFLNKLNELWLLYPDYRFGQLIYLFAEKIRDGRFDIFFPEEEEWIDGIQKCIDDYKKLDKNKKV